MQRFSLRRLNNYLAVVTIVVCLYTAALPLMPVINFWIQNSAAHFKAPTTPDNLVVKLSTDRADINTLTIPKLFVKTIINEGTDTTALEHGVWHRPATGTPDTGGNMVIAGHRFIYGSNSAFYYLDKLIVDDLIGLHWRGKQYIYQVTDTKAVDPTDVGIEAPTKTPQLTLFTCTPLWTSKQRLVVTAKLIKDSQ